MTVKSGWLLDLTKSAAVGLLVGLVVFNGPAGIAESMPRLHAFGERLGGKLFDATHRDDSIIALMAPSSGDWTPAMANVSQEQWRMSHKDNGECLTSTMDNVSQDGGQ